MNKTRIVAVATAFVAVSITTATPALATHAHSIWTPGTCVDRAGAGFGAGEVHDETSFHHQVHTGVPGSFAFEQTEQVEIKRGTCP